MAKEDVLVTRQSGIMNIFKMRKRRSFRLKHAMGNWLDSLHMRFVLNML